MIIQYLVERDEPESVVKMPSGFRHAFKRNEHGHKIAEICNEESIAYMLRSPEVFKEYALPEEAQGQKQRRDRRGGKNAKEDSAPDGA